MKSRAIIFCAGMGVVLALASLTQAGVLAVYGGPSYDAATGNGYMGGAATGINDSGVAVGYASIYANGAKKGYTTDCYRAVRWDSSGSMEMDCIFQGGAYDPQDDPFMQTQAYAINNAGTAVGYSNYIPGGDLRGSRPTSWDAAGNVTQLGDLGTANDYGDTHAAALAINASGTAVGWASKYQYDDETGLDYRGSRAARWDASGTVTELGSIEYGTDSDGYGESQALAVNASGVAVGWAEKFTPSGSESKGNRAVRWNADGTAMELDDLGLSSDEHTTLASALAVNNAGTAVGKSLKYDGGEYKGWRAVRWDASGTAATELGNLGTTASGVTQGQAVAINAAGTAVGQMEKYDIAHNDKGTRAVRWDAAGTDATELGILGTDGNGWTDAAAEAINTAGIAVGWANEYLAGSLVGTRAVYWGSNGVAVDLNTLIDPNSGWTLEKATAVSDTGWIAGIGLYDPDGAGGADAYERLFSLQIPEPASMVLLALGGLALLKRRHG
ncbi:MAG: DUF3466 family protein [Phycisphaerae bacterium]